MTPLEAELTEKLEQANRQIALLRQKLDALARRIYGTSSEKLDAGQLELLLQLSSGQAAEEKEVVPPAPAAEKFPAPRKARSPRLPENLPVIEEVIDPEPVKAAPEQWRCIGEEVTEQLDYEPARFLRRRLIRRKYVHRQEADGAPVIAPLPECLQERGLAAAGLLAQVVVSKYCDHLPLYRQEQIYAQRHGVALPRQTLGRWMELVADWLRPIYEQIRSGVLAGGYAQVDETPVDYLAPGTGQAQQGYLWVCHRPGGDVFFQWETSRAASCLERLIPSGFEGVLQTDGYSAYRSFAGTRAGRVQLAGCWAHVRRKFYEALEQAPGNAGWVLRQIQHLYRIEARLRERGSGPRLRTAVRAEQSRPILNRLRQALEKLKGRNRYLPKSLMGQAIEYALGQWEPLETFQQNGRVELDNNLVENAIRPTALGKKNWLFMGEAAAGQRSAVLYTVIESCRRRGLDPYRYLRDVLTRLPRLTNHQVDQLLPSRWAVTSKPALQPLS